VLNSYKKTFNFVQKKHKNVAFSKVSFIKEAHQRKVAAANISLAKVGKSAVGDFVFSL
jgi:hypothetical protein